jgi:hypothetical protein
MSGIEHDQNEYENGRTRGILRNNPLANKLVIKGLRSCLDAMEHTRSPSTDSIAEYDPKDDSDLDRDPSLCSSPDESESDGLSYSPIKVLALTWQGCIGHTYLALLLLCYTAIYLVYTSYMRICHAYPFSVPIPCVIILGFSTQMLFFSNRCPKGRG